MSDTDDPMRAYVRDLFGTQPEADNSNMPEGNSPAAEPDDMRTFTSALFARARND